MFVFIRKNIYLGNKSSDLQDVLGFFLQNFCDSPVILHAMLESRPLLSTAFTI